MFILVVNAGSSSLKYQLFDMDNESVLAKGNCERIGLDGIITHTRTADGRKYKAEIPMPTHVEATRAMIDALLDREHGVLTDMKQISAIGHRVVQGGPWLTKPTLVTDESVADLERCVDLAPLHTVPHLQGIKGCRSVLPDTPMVLVIDTSFHATMPDYAATFPIDIKVARKYHIRRYGAHGTSHRYVSQECIRYLGKPAEDTRIVTCHLGNGSSISAVKGGKVIDTSMGFTPLDGIIMGSRCGGIDPAVVPFVMRKEGIAAEDMGDWLNKKCGLLGVSGVSSDLRDVLAAIKSGNADARLAYNILVYQIKKFVGAYAAAMGGVDAVVFTAGIGENNASVRADALDGLGFLGIEIDAEKNAAARTLPPPCDISAEGAKVRVFVIPTNEELVIARDTLELVSKLK